MSIIVFLCMCQPDELPPTATKMYASFILHTICHYLKRVGKIPKDKIINKLEQFPPVVYTALQDLEKTAFDGLVEDKIVFTVEELPVLCKDDPTCYGLLQSTECYSAEEIGTPTQSFNFLHLGVQEYFAAKFVTTLPEDQVYTLLKESFVVTESIIIPSNSDSKSVRLSNMWILYCGITSGQCKTLRHYLTTYGKPRDYYFSDSDDDDYRDCNYDDDEMLPFTFDDHMTLHFNPHKQQLDSTLFPSTTSMISQRCHPTLPSAAERYSTTTTSKHVNNNIDSQVTSEKMAGPSQQGSNYDQRISNTGTISQDILKDSVKVLYLFQCFREAQDNVLCEVLSKSFDDEIGINHHSFLPHQVVSLGFFLSRSHRKWKVLSLQWCHIGDHGMSILHQYLCGDKTNKQKITKINLTENDLTGASSHLIGDIISHLEPHILQLGHNNITNVRDISTAVITTSTVKVLYMNSNDLTAQEAIAISDMMICLEELDIVGNNLGDHGAELLSEGIINTKTLRVLDISNNNIGPSGTTAIANALSNNTSLEELNMKHNPIGLDGAKALGSAIINNKNLKKLSLHVNEKGKESAMIIIRSLYNNNTITKLCLYITLCKTDVDLVTREAEMINSIRKLHNEHVINFLLYFNDPQGEPRGHYTTEEKLSWWT